MAPLWVPRTNADYLVVTCPECLRSSSICDDVVDSELHEVECLSCSAPVRYLVDSSILKLLDNKTVLLP
jgi:hypothetical protein